MTKFSMKKDAIESKGICHKTLLESSWDQISFRSLNLKLRNRFSPTFLEISVPHILIRETFCFL